MKEGGTVRKVPEIGAGAALLEAVVDGVVEAVGNKLLSKKTLREI